MFRNNISAAYVLLVGLPLLLLLGVLQTGSSLPAPVSVAVEHSQPSPAPAPLNLIKLVLQIGVILVVARIVGMFFRKIRQPQVVGEMVAGILLGPSFGAGALVWGWGRLFRIVEFLEEFQFAVKARRGRAYCSLQWRSRGPRRPEDHIYSLFSEAWAARTAQYSLEQSGNRCQVGHSASSRASQLSVFNYRCARIGGCNVVLGGGTDGTIRRAAQPVVLTGRVRQSP